MQIEVIDRFGPAPRREFSRPIRHVIAVSGQRFVGNQSVSVLEAEPLFTHGVEDLLEEEGHPLNGKARDAVLLEEILHAVREQRLGFKDGNALISYESL